MISAVVFVPEQSAGHPGPDGDQLVQSLVWLVSAVVAGMVRDVILAGPPDSGLPAIADQSGCAIVEARDEAGRLAKAMVASKCSRVLLMTAAYQPAETMIGELDRVARTIAPEETARLLAAPASAWQRLFPDRAPTVGLFAPATRLRTLAGRDFRQIEARLKPRVRFATRASPIF